jgi:16S rRNA (cytosine967-C5)-methyltransferase
MLANAIQCVKEGGVLLYAVCSITQEESLQVVERFLADHPTVSLDPFANPLTGAATDGTLQIWPWEGPGDGMFIARMVNVEDA